jgi:glutamyl-tRNA reductase
MIQDIQIIGASWKQFRQEEIEKITLPEEHLQAALKGLMHDYPIDEVAYLTTCNRTELIIASNERDIHLELRNIWSQILKKHGIEQDINKKMTAWLGEGAFEHLYMVASGLESASLGENEILSQLKLARDYAQTINTFGPRLDLLFSESFKVAASIKSNTKISHGQRSLSEIAVKEVVSLHQKNKDIHIGLIGRSAVIENAIKSLDEKNIKITLFNRSLDKVKTIEEKYKINALSLDELKNNCTPLDIIITATKSPLPLLDHQALHNIFSNSKSPTIIDLASPSDFDKAVCESLKIKYISLDDIIDIAKMTHAKRADEKQNAREIVDTALIDLHQKLSDIQFNSLYSALQQRYQFTAHEGIKKLVKKNIPGLSNDAITELEVWCQAMAKRFAHIPTMGLRGLVHNGPEGSVEAFINGLDDKFQNELEKALKHGSRPYEN